MPYFDTLFSPFFRFCFRRHFFIFSFAYAEIRRHYAATPLLPPLLPFRSCCHCLPPPLDYTLIARILRYAMIFIFRRLV